MAASLPITCTATIVSASDCVGFTLPGMMDEPGSFSGSVSSPRPQRGPEASQRMSLAILMSEAARVFNAPERKRGFVGREGRVKFVGGGGEGKAGQFRDFASGAFRKFGRRVQAG